MRRTIFFLLLLCASCACLLVSSTAQAQLTNTVAFPWQDFQGKPQVNYPMKIKPADVGTNGPALTTIDPKKSFITDTNGQIVITNMVPGGYSAWFFGPSYVDGDLKTATAISFVVPATNGTFNIKDLTSVPLPIAGANNAYSMVASDARYVQLPPTNTTSGYVATAGANGSVSWLPGGAGSQTPFAQDVDAAKHSLTNLNTLSATNIIATNLIGNATAATNLLGNIAPSQISSGTAAINISGTASGAPPTGTAGGFLSGTYPNPTLSGSATIPGSQVTGTVPAASSVPASGISGPIQSTNLGTFSTPTFTQETTNGIYFFGSTDSNIGTPTSPVLYSYVSANNTYTNATTHSWMYFLANDPNIAGPGWTVTNATSHNWDDFDASIPAFSLLSNNGFPFEPLQDGTLLYAYPPNQAVATWTMISSNLPTVTLAAPAQGVLLRYTNTLVVDGMYGAMMVGNSNSIQNINLGLGSFVSGLQNFDGGYGNFTSGRFNTNYGSITAILGGYLNYVTPNGGSGLIGACESCYFNNGDGVSGGLYCLHFTNNVFNNAAGIMCGNSVMDNGADGSAANNTLLLCAQNSHSWATGSLIGGNFGTNAGSALYVFGDHITTTNGNEGYVFGQNIKLNGANEGAIGAGLTNTSAGTWQFGTTNANLTFSNASVVLNGILTGNGSGLTNITASSLAISNAPAASPTNYTVTFGNTIYNEITGTATNVCFNSFAGTSGPATYFIQPTGTNIVVLWPTNLCTMPTNNLTLIGTNWSYTVTNKASSQFVISFFAKPGFNMTNILASWSCTP